MIGTAEILSIISIAITMILGTHIAFKSECFGFMISSDGNELDIKFGNYETEIKPNEIDVECIDLSGNKTEIASIPINLPIK